MQQMVDQMNAPAVASRLASQVELDLVEMYPYIEYIKYLLAGSIALSHLRRGHDRRRHHFH